MSRDAPGNGAGAPAEARRQSLAVLRAGWREGSRGDLRWAYTCPSPRRYPWQWYWDSAFVAIAARRSEPDRARRELASLLDAQRPNGFIGHTVFWGSPVHWHRLPFYNVTSRRAASTETIQPPMLAWAWSLCVGDPATESRIARHHAWLAEHRDLDADGLLWIVQPDESGLDASPKFDPVWGVRAHARERFPLLVRRNRRHGFDARRILAAGGPVLCEVLTNTLWGLSRLACGDPSITPRLVDRLWDERSGLFVDEVRPGGARPHVLTWAALAPLALPDLPEEIGRRLVEEHLLERFWTPLPVPSVPPGSYGYMEGEGAFPRRYWRGPAWVNAAWLVWLGLRRLGYAEQAAELVERYTAAIAREGLREFYDPLTAAGHGARDFAWSALVLDMLADDPAAAHSYLPPPKPTTSDRDAAPR